MPLFEIAVIQKASKKELDAGEPAEKLLMAPVTMLAKDSQTAAMMVMMGSAAPKDMDLNRAEILVRPFV